MIYFTFSILNSYWGKTCFHSLTVILCTAGSSSIFQAAEPQQKTGRIKMIPDTPGTSSLINNLLSLKISKQRRSRELCCLHICSDVWLLEREDGDVPRVAGIYITCLCWAGEMFKAQQLCVVPPITQTRLCVTLVKTPSDSEDRISFSSSVLCVVTSSTEVEQSCNQDKCLMLERNRGKSYR